MDSKLLNKRKLENDDEIKVDAEKIKKSEFYKEQGNEFYKKQLFDDALDSYFKSITLNQNNPKCYCNIGQILINKSKYSEAKECLQEAINLDPKYVKAYYRLGLVEKHLNNFYEAAKNFNQVLRIEKDNKAAIKELQQLTPSINGEENHEKLVDKVGSISLNNQKSSVNQKSNSVKPIVNHKKLDKNISNLTFPKLNTPVQLPSSPPQTAYQFNLYWKEFDDCKTKLDYLRSIGSKHFLKLFKKNLEPDFLSELIVLFNSLEKNLVHDYLNSITEIENFDFLIMFLSKSEKEALKQLIISLDSNQTELINSYKL